MDFMNIIKAALASLLSLSIVGCATIAGDNNRAIKVDSHPAGAAIFVDGQQYGTTPAVVTLPTYIYGGKSVTLRKAGYHDHTMMVNSKFQPIALLDIFLWPTFILDAATGSLVKIDPANLNLNADLERAR
jgi:PEGA domain